MKKYDSAVSLVRVFSMLLVVVTHLLSWKNINSFQISTIGVASFLFISGYLYSERKIDSCFIWMKQRVKRVLVPFWVLIFFLTIYLIAKGEILFAVKQLFETLFNLQGVHFLIKGEYSLGYMHLSGVSHCWFLTVIFVCYFLVCLLKKSFLENIVEKKILFFLIIAVLCHVVLCYINITIGYVVVFFVGYFYEKKEKKFMPISNKFCFFAILVCCFVFVLRLLLKSYVDETVFYNDFFASFSANVCAIVFFISVKKITIFFAVTVNMVTSSRLWKKVDVLSFPVFLTHYMFLTKPFNINALEIHPFFQILLFISFTLFSAVVVDTCSKVVIKKFDW